MKFFHLSDLHIGLKLINRDLKEDHEYILKQIIDRAAEERPDAILIAGDIYDKAVPSAESTEIFDEFINNITSALPKASIMIISGNHDSAARLNCFRNLLSKNNLYMIGVPPVTPDEYIQKVSLNDEYGKVNFYLLPFVKPSTVRRVLGTEENLSYNETVHRLIKRENIDLNERNVIVSHQFYLPKGKSADDTERMDSEIRTVGNIDEVSADILECFEYAALGHIHKPMVVGDPKIRYSGTPIACSVSEAGQSKGIVSVEMFGKNDGLKIKTIPLEPLRNVRVVKGTLNEVLNETCNDYVTVILTDKYDINIIDMQEKLHRAFPYLLEIRREIYRKADYESENIEETVLEPYELCCSFLKDLDENEKRILSDVINTVQGVK